MWGDGRIARAAGATGARRARGLVANRAAWGEPEASYFTPFARVVASTVAIAVLALGLTIGPSAPAEAAVVQWGTNSGTDPNYQDTVNGDFINAGNGVLACSSVIGTTNGSCLNLHAASNGTASNVNDNAIMANSNTVTGFSTNSSSATVTVPNGATVVRAFLSWSAMTGIFTGDTRVLCAAFSDARGVATRPAGSTTGYLTQGAQLKVGSGAVTTFAPNSVLVDPATQPSSLYYSATSDVTSAFAAAGTGTALTVSAGNIWTPTGAGCYAGWSITLVYDFGTYIPGNLASVPHRVIYYEGHVREGAGEAALTVAFDDFTAVDTGTRLGYTLFEGDRNITGDTLTYSRAGSATFTEVTSSAGATGNIGIGRATGSVRYTQTADTSAFTNQSVDVATGTLGTVIAGDSSVSLRVGTTGDSYLMTNAVLSVPVAGIQVDKSLNGTLDTQSRLSTETATFTITVTNTGAGNLRNIVVTDDRPDCARTLTGLVLAPLASTTYTCTGAPSGTGYTSTATATGYTVNGNYLANDSDATAVLLTAIGLTKTSALAGGATGRAGDIVNYTFVATNTGQSTLTGVAVVDALAGLSPLTYGTWPSGTAGTLAGGQSVTATATRALTQADVDAGSVSNTATTTASDNDAGPKPTASATRVTTIASNPGLSVTKTGALASGATGAVGDRINYAFTFTNTGNVTLTNTTLVDPLPGLSPPVVTWPGTAGTLAPGQTATATAFVIVTQANVNSGSVKNTATATGTAPGGATTSSSSPQVTVATVPTAPSIVTTKSAVVSGAAAVGDSITYSFSARNSGNVTLTGVVIADPLPGLSALTYSWPGTAGTLTPGQTVTATATYTITQANVDAGSVRNTATSSATTPAGATISSPSALVTTATAAAAPNAVLTKSGALATGATGRAGDTVTYTFTLRNSGNVTLTGAAITDPLSGLSAITYAAWPSGTAGTLAPGQTVTATATYALKQTDVDAGSVANTATATAKPPTGANLTRTAPATVAITPTGSLALTKSGVVTSGTGGVGSTVTYSFTLRNTGNVTLTQVVLTDPLPGLSTPVITWPGTAGTLAPAQQATATATYTVRQSDVDAGSVRNTASSTARTPAGAAVSTSSPQSIVPTAAAAPSITTTKAASVSGTGAAGDVITYTLTVRNAGNVTVTGVSVSDPLAGLSPLIYTWPGSAGTLAPGQTGTAIASYTIKQSDVNAGSVTNTASAAGAYGATALTASSGAVVTPTATRAPAITTTKSGVLASGSTGRAGDLVNWTITLRNSGNVTLTAVSAADSLPGISALTYGAWPSGTAGTLQPGQTVTATATYPLKQTDVDAGSVSNTATGSGTPPIGPAVSSSAPATVPVTSVPSLTLAKTGAVTTGSGAVGDRITYSFTARNSGNVTLTGVAIADPLPGLSAVTYGTWPDGTAGRLAPGQQVTATASYLITQSDVNTGSVRNTATVTGTPPTGPAVTASSPLVAVNTVAAAPSITTSKSATGGGGGVGSTITYTFVTRNSGNVTLTGVAVSDPLAGLSALAYGAWPSGTAGTLQPGQTVTATATYVVRQADVNTGSVTNRSSATGTPPTGAAVTAQSAPVVTPTATPTPSIALTKTGTLAAGSAGVVGDRVDYTFTARNSGNVTLTAVRLADPLPGLSPITFGTWPSGTAGTLQPGQAVTATASRILTQADVDAGSVANTATATGTPPTGADVSREAPATVAITAGPAISVVKSGALAPGATGVAGDTVRFAFTVRNEGNVTLTAVSITDSLAGLSPLAYTWPGVAGTLAPGQTATATATYVLKQSDVDTGSVRNRATVSGRPPTGATVSGQSAEVVVPTAPAVETLTLTKTAATTAGRAVGDSITYSFRLTNTGNRTLSSVSLADPLAGLTAISVRWPGSVGTLAPAQVLTGTATYVIRQADVDAGSVDNRATASAVTPGGATITTQSALVVTPTATAAPALTVTKTGAAAPGATGRAGDRIDFTVTLRNTGNQTLTGVSATDSLPGLAPLTYGTWPSGTVGVLAPGQSVVATAGYTDTQADVDSGAISNTATGTATAPGGAILSSTASATVPIARVATLSLTETAVYTTGSGVVGDTITFTYTARNTGNQTLTSVAIAPTLAGLTPLTYTWPGQPGTLAPDQVVTATATHVVTQADVNTGSVRDTSTITGTPPSGPVATASATAAAPTVASGPAITTTKTSAVSGSGVVGDVVTYTFVARNSGNVTLTGVRIADPLPGLSPITFGAWPSGTAGTLQPGQQVTATATYRITQADVNRGSITNSASSAGTPPTGAEVSSASTQVVTSTVVRSPSVVVSKSGVLAAGSAGAAGDTVSWSFTLRNAGNVTLTGAAISDSLPSISPVVFGPFPGGTVGVLQPGESVSASASSVLSQADVDAGAVSNTATGSGVPPTGAAATSTAPATVPIPSSAAITVQKSGSLTSGTGVAGDTVTFEFLVRNAGNVTLRDVAIADPLAGIGPITFGAWPTGEPATLGPGQQVSATTSYVLRQSDVNAGSVTNTATVSGRPQVGPVVQGVATPATVATAASAPSIVTTKSATVSGAGGAGDVITYTVTARNTGNVTLSGVGITDTLPGLSPLLYGGWPSGVTGVLQPNTQVSATATYRITQTDVDRGSVANTATGVGTAPGGLTVSNASAPVVTGTAVAGPGILLGQSGALAAGSSGRAGDTVRWAFTLTNTGNVTLTGAQISPAPLNGMTPVTYGVWPSGTSGVLLPGQTVTAASTSVLTQADVDRGSVTDAATSSGTSPSGVVVTSADPATVSVPRVPSVVVEKTGELAPDASGAAGEPIVFGFVIRNTGNVTLTGVVLTDTLAGLTAPVLTFDGGIAGTLAPGQTATGTATYTTLQSDVNAGVVRNTASVSADAPDGSRVGDTSDEVLVATGEQRGQLVTTKTAAVSGAGNVGDVVTYSVSARNAGNLTLTDVEILDTLPGLSALAYTWPGATGILDPNQTVTATATYAITQADVNRGSITNTATSRGETDLGIVVTSPAVQVVTSTVLRSPSVVVSKSGVLAAGSAGAAGDTVSWSFTLRNTGNVTLTGAAISDSLPSISPVVFGPFPGGTVGVLQPGESVSASASSVLSQADVDAGAVSNTATGSGVPPSGAAATSTAPATVPISPLSDLDLTKSGTITTGTGEVGDTITYTFRAVNAGDSTLRGVVIADELPGIGPITYGPWPSGTVGTLGPDQAIVASATYLITQSDVDSGSIGNTADAIATAPDGTAVPATSNTVVVDTVEPAPELTTTKEAVDSTSRAVGDSIDYVFTVTNSGNTTVTGVTIVDGLDGLSPLVYGGWPSATAGTLLPGQQVTATASYPLDQADIDAGAVDNTAYATGAAAVSGTPVQSPDAQLSTPTDARAPGIRITDAGALAPGASGRAGDRVDWTYVVTNTGNVTLTGVEVTENLAGTSAPVYQWPSTPGILLPGESVTVSTTYLLTQADVDAGTVASDVDVSSTGPAGESVTGDAAATVELEASGSLRTVKSGTLVAPGIGQLGDLVRYRLEITNTGNVTLTNGRLTDPLPGLSVPRITWPDPARPGRVGVGETVIGIADYPLTQADIDRGYIDNEATVAATTPAGDLVTSASNIVRVAAVQASPSISTTKTAVGAGGGVGDTISYSITARNSGNVTLTGVAVGDPLPGLSALEFGPWPGGVTGTLAPGAQVTATADYVLTQADVDRGFVSNTATATGVPPAGTPVVTGDSGSITTLTEPARPTVTVTDTGDLDGTGVAGDPVTWTYRFTNTGNVTLSGVLLTDSLTGVGAPAYTWPGVPGVLNPGQSVDATALYTLTQSDVDAGSVTSVVTGTGTPPVGAAVSATAPATVTIASGPDLDIDIAADPRLDARAGDVIDYLITVVNTGNVTVTGLVFGQRLPNLQNVVVTWPGVSRVLQPGQTATVSGSYTVTQADVDAGFVRNQGTIRGTVPGGAPISRDSAFVVTPTPAAAPSIVVAKSATVAGVGAVGEVITYTFRITNPGNVTLTGVDLDDPLPGLNAPAIRWPAAAGVLAPGAVATATATYTITQADVDAGSVTNEASVSGNPPTGPAVTDLSGVVETPTLQGAATTIVVDSGTLAPGATGRAGDVVTWKYVLTNTGEVTLTEAQLSDALPGVTSPVYAWLGTPGVLAPGESVTATATYVLTQADVDFGSVTSTVTGSGNTPSGEIVTSTDSATLPLPPTPSLVAVKSGEILAPGIGQVGDTVRYVLDITNTGNVTLTGGQLLDPLPGLSVPVITWPNPAQPGRLGVGETVRGVATYQLTQTDVDAGAIVNEASVRAFTPKGVAVFADSNVVTVPTVQPAAALTVVQTGSASGTAGVGDTITWTVQVRNTGNVSVDGIAVATSVPGLVVQSIVWPFTPGLLAPGQVATLTGTSVISQADVDAGSVTDVATASGSSVRDDAPVTSGPVPATVPTAASTADVLVTKSAVLAAGSTGVAGDLVEWSYSLTNTGNVTLTGVELTDGLAATSPLTYVWPGTPGVLAPGAVVRATATYPLTQADIDAAGVTSAVTGVATPPIGADLSESATAGVTIAQRPAFELTKAGTVAGDGGVGDAIDYDFTITNTGNVTLTLVDLLDGLAGVSDPEITWPGAEGVLAPGEVAPATARYLITQADIDAGSVTNVATATGKPPVGDTISTSSPSTITAVQPGLPSIALGQTAVVAGTGAVGDLITYTFLIQNDGNVTLSGTALNPLLDGLGTPSVVWPGVPGVLAPGQSATATATYAITQADIDAGEVVSTALASGDGPAGDGTTDVSSITTPVASATPGISVTDSGVLAPGATGRAGDTVEWTYLLTNTGNVTLTGATVSDSLVGVTAPAFVWPGTPGVLLPGESVTATAAYVLTQADVDSGLVTSAVTASATTPDATTVDDTATAPVTIAAAPGLLPIKTGVIRAPGTGQLGDTIRYVLDITNVGNVTVTSGRLLDPLPGLSVPVITWPDPARPGRLGVGETVRGVATYQLTQDDIDRGYIDNEASVAAVTPAGVTITADSNLVRVVTALPAPSIATTKSGALVGVGGVGDTVEYTITSRNTGSVTLTGVTIDDPLDGLSALQYGPWPSGTVGTLAPGQEVTATASYELTQADVDRGSVSNTATSTGVPPNGSAAVTGASLVTEVATAAAVATATVSDVGVLAPGASGVAGDTVEWTYRFTNTGNVTLGAVSMQDALAGVSAPVYTWPGVPGVLRPGQTVEATATSVLTQADVDSGALSSVVTGTGTPPSGAPVTATASATVTLAAAPGLSVVKRATLAAAGQNGVGDRVLYTFELSNTGNVTLRDVVLTDLLAGVTAPVVTWPTPAAGVIPPGTVATATAGYVLQQEDVDRGSVANTATVDATTPLGERVSARSTAATVITEAPAPSIDVIKGGSIVTGDGSAGSVVRYTFEITNTGNVTLNLISLTDSLAGVSRPVLDFPSTTGVLAPGAKAIGTATYTIRQADVDRGSVSSQATVVGTAPDGTVVTDVSDLFTIDTAAAAPAITTTHTASLAAGATGVLGDTVEYRFTIRNDGNTTLTDVQLTNSVSGLTAPVFTWPGAVGVLAPGQSATAVATRAVTQADVDAGAVRNVATASGSSPAGARVSDPSEESVVALAVGGASLTLAKTGTVTGTGAVGDTVSYEFTVTNRGAVSVSGVAISDALPGLSAIAYGAWPTGTVGLLPPGTTVGASASYVIRQSDLDRGDVRNTATVAGTRPGGAAVGAVSPQSVVDTAAQAPSIDATKTQALRAGATGRAGDVVEYSFTVTNTGNTTLDGVTLTDGQPGISALVYSWPGTASVLLPGQSATATATYVLTQADVDSGSVSSDVTASGTSPIDAPVSDVAAGSLTIAAAPGLSLVKSSALRTAAQQGAIVDYAFTVTNTGNVTLTGVEIDDPLPRLGALEYTWPAAPGVLLPGQTVAATAPYTIDQTDVDAGSIANTASVTADDTAGAVVSAVDSDLLTIPDEPGIRLDMSVALGAGQQGFAGDTLVYTYVITNTGTKTLSGVRIVDGRTGLSPIVYGAWPGTPGVLAPGQSVTATATMVITPAMEGTVVTGTARAVASEVVSAEAVVDVDDASIQLPTRPVIIPTAPTDPLVPIAPAAPRPPLAYTGGEVAPLGSAAALLLLSGLTLMLAAVTGRRKPDQEEELA